MSRLFSMTKAPLMILPFRRRATVPARKGHFSTSISATFMTVFII
jgi:hypothetical protein